MRCRVRRTFGTTMALVALTALGISSCSSNSSPSAGEAGGTAYSVGTIEPNSLIPGKSTSGQLPLAALFTPLVGVDRDGGLTNLQAESVVGSNAMRTWTITLRQGWTFHNGEPVTATSYVDAWNYNAYGPNGFPGGGELSKIVGFDKLNPAKGTPTTKELSGLKVLDTYAFQVDLTQSDSQFPYQLTANMWGFYPLPKSAYDDMDAYNEKPIGDGPYQMKAPWQHDQSIQMVAFDGYAGTDKPKTKNLTFMVYSSADTAYTDALAGNVDIASVPGDKLGQFKKDFGDRWFVRGGQNIEFLGFPLFDPKWKDVRIRQAVSMAIDRSAINKSLFGGVYEDASSLLPPTTPGGNPKSCEYCSFDPARAKELLAQAGGFSGKMVIAYLGGYGLDQEYQAIANQLRQNLQIDVEALPSPTIAAFYTNLGEKKYVSGPFYGSWGAAFPSAENVLAPNFTATGIAQTGTYYTNDSVTALIADGNAAASQADAVEKYHAAEAQIQADFPVVPLFFMALPMVHSDKVTHVDVDSLTNLVYTGITVAG